MASTLNSMYVAHLFPIFLFFLLGPPHLEVIKRASCTETLNPRCLEMETTALLTFKESAKDPLGQLSSWIGEYCCKWAGVGVEIPPSMHIHMCSHRKLFVVLGNPSLLQQFMAINCGTEFSLVSNYWLQVVNMLPSLLESHLRGCGLQSLPQSISSINFTLLLVLDFSLNGFDSLIPSWLSNVSGLSILNISSNSLYGTILDAFANIYSLQELDLSSNQWIEGPLPAGLGNLTNFHTLSLSGNNVTSGEMTELMHDLSQYCNSNLESLYLSGNDLLGGNVPYSLGGLKNLKSINLVDCSFWVSIPDSTRNLSSLKILDLQYNQMNESILESIGKLSKLLSLDLSNNIWDSTLALEVHSDWVPPFKLWYVDLHNIYIGPRFSKRLQTQDEIQFLNLNNFGIFDTIPHGFWNSCSNIINLILFGNKLYKQVPHFQIHPLVVYINLSSNNFEGPLPLFFSNLIHIYLNDNMFSGPIPKNIGELLPRLFYLDLSSNFVDKKIPLSIGMLQILGALSLDVSRNRLFGNLPTWIGESLPLLFRLNLRSNFFSGHILLVANVSARAVWTRLHNTQHIPQQLCHLFRLRILDLAHNELSGGIPPCLGNFSEGDKMFISSTYKQMLVVSKGRNYLYESTLYLIHCKDLSSNNLSGEIPDTITSFPGLIILNLNGIFGPIPASLSSLNFLSYLNLSFNNLFGKISRGSQFQTLNDPSIYQGNSLLCDETEPGHATLTDDGTNQLLLYVIMAVGFVVGFWGVCGTLIVKTLWRIVYFRMFDNLKDKIYIFVMVKGISHLQRKLGRRS
ncbi:hypothetical protein I3760_10G088100 [Carya illinoinensis]|nr:hypothetical protein I3760_10G088100 [Carya illinoinensis]